MKYFSSSGCRFISLHIVAEEQGANKHIVLLCPELWQFEHSGFLLVSSDLKRCYSRAQIPRVVSLQQFVQRPAFLAQVFQTVSAWEIHKLQCLKLLTD